MIYFTAEEIYLSIMYSFIYGIGFALILTLLKVLLGAGGALGKYGKSILHYDRIAKVEKFCKYSKTSPRSRIYLVFAISMFFLGYLLLSYYALDGNLRIYTFVIALLGALFFRNTAEPLIATALFGLTHCLICPILILLRIIMHPIFSKGKKILTDGKKS